MHQQPDIQSGLIEIWSILYDSTSIVNSEI